MKLRSKVDIYKVTPLYVAITDECDGCMSVTNDAEAVVNHLLREYGQRRIYYRDTEGRWDELKHEGGAFTDFSPLTDDQVKDILADPDEPEINIISMPDVPMVTGMKDYLGDSVYVNLDAAQRIILTTENGLPLDPSNRIVLEPEVVCALWSYVQRAKQRIAADSLKPADGT